MSKVTVDNISYYYYYCGGGNLCVLFEASAFVVRLFFGICTVCVCVCVCVLGGGNGKLA